MKTNTGFGHTQGKRLLVALLFLSPGPGLLAQLTLRLTAWPPFPPPYESIYVAGNFNGWNPGNAAYQLTLQPNDEYAITFDPPVGNLEFKFTRGNWETGESLANGGFRPNRTYTYTGQPKTLLLTVDGWSDLAGVEHTAGPNVSLLDDDFFMPQLNRNRRIWLSLPPDYDSTEKEYPVVYLQDGQNLFDKATAYAGEWRIDEAMDSLFGLGDHGAIIVGIENGGTERVNEYSPWVHPTYGGGDGEHYAEFLATTLKPWIDNQYRTRRDALFTGVGGSSMGGLISLYTAVEYPDVFGKALVFSPSLWFSDSTFQYVSGREISPDLRMILAGGTQESAGMVPDMLAMRELLISRGADPDDILVQADPDGVHNEGYWAREYPDAYLWLFQQAVSATGPVPGRIRTAYPNPARDSVTLDLEAGMPARILVITAWGRVMESPSRVTGTLDISGWAPGTYYLQAWYADRTLPDVFRIVKQ